jgi:hypothetical protein
MANESKNQEFRVTISGLDLAPEHVERINRAVQAAVLTELAEVASPAIPINWGVRGPRPPIMGIIVQREDTRE